MDEPVYSGDSGEGFLIAALDSLTAIYHRRSGVTHIVAEPVPEILSALAGKQMTAAGLFADLMGDAKPMEGEMMAALQARLDELTEVGLVSRA